MLSRNIIFFVLLFCMASFADFSKGISYGDVKEQRPGEMKQWPVRGIYDDFDYDACVEASIKATGVKQGNRFGCWRYHLENCEVTERRLSQQLESLPQKFGVNDSAVALVLQVAQFEKECLKEAKMEAYRPRYNEKYQSFKSLFASYTQSFSETIYEELEGVNQRIADQQSRGWHFNMRNIGDVGSLDFLKEESLEGYVEFLKSLKNKITKNLFPIFSDVITEELRLLNEGKEKAKKYCVVTQRSTIQDLDDMDAKCTDMNLSEADANSYGEKAKNQRGYLTWQKIVEQVSDSSQDIYAGISLLEDYLDKYPKGTFAKQANELYEKTLIREGLNEVKKDTLLGLSNRSLLRRYLEKCPQGKSVERVSDYLEKLFFDYSMSELRKDPKEAILPNSYPDQYLVKYPEGKYRDSLNVALENAYWEVYSEKCAKDQILSSCEPLFTFFAKFPNSNRLDSVGILIDEPLWALINEGKFAENCRFPEDAGCSEVERYAKMIPWGKHAKEAKKILANAKDNDEKRELEKEREKRAVAWFDEYENTSTGCSFVAKKDRYDFEWGEQSFPEKNGTIECVWKMDLSLDTLDTLNYKCLETEKIVVKGGKMTGGKGFCLNAHSDTLVRRVFLNNGKSKTTYYFPDRITFVSGVNGEYSITSKKFKLKELGFHKIMTILSQGSIDLSYLYDVDNFEFDWTKSGQIKNIRITDYNEQGKVMGKLNVPLNVKGEKHGVSEIYTASTGNFKIEWNNGKFKRIYGGGKKLKDNLCPKYVCSNLIWKLQESNILHHYVPTLESSRESGYQGFEEGWMLHYIAYLLGITINEGLEIWNSL